MRKPTPVPEETEIRALLDEMTAAWNRGDAQAFGARTRDDASFTNVFGTVHFGRDAFIRRHGEVFQGFLKDTRITLAARKLNFVRADVAVADIDMSYSGFKTRPPGVPAMPDGLVHSSLLMVLVKEAGVWGIATYHNVWRTI